MKKNKFTAILTAFALFAGTLAGCSQSGTSDPPSTNSGANDVTPSITCVHEYVSAVLKEPTYDSEGEMIYSCEKCGDTYTEAIEKLTGIPNDVLDDALSNIKYYSNPFSITLGKLINTAMGGYDIQYLTGEEAIAQEYLSEDELGDSVDLSYVYYAIISGDVMLNPDIPYMTNYEEEAIKGWMVFDKNDQLQGYSITLCYDLQTCAFLIMTDYY